MKVKDGGPFWVISANTVENIEELYVEYGPRKLDRMMPKWSKSTFLGIPWWKLVGTFLLIIVSYYLSKWSSRVIANACKKSDKKWLVPLQINCQHL